jgi:hypothetical protein
MLMVPDTIVESAQQTRHFQLIFRFAGPWPAAVRDRFLNPSVGSAQRPCASPIWNTRLGPMTSRQRKNSSLFRTDSASRHQKRKHLLEALEPRQLLAGPQLIGIQPNEGDLIVEGSVLNVAPRALTFRFDENQSIDPATFDGIRVTRAGDDGQLGTSDDIRLNTGLVTLGDTATNEVVVRFSDALPDDRYNVEVFGFDDNGLGITGLRNINGELLQPRVAGQRLESTTFTLKLGAQIEAVVPQPVIRKSDGSLVQNRNEIVVYFNEDPLFVENDANGNPTKRSAENPRFYQLFLTQDTVRTTDDALYHPQRVIYDANTHTARLIFAADLNKLGPDADGMAGVPLTGGTFRLRIGTAVDDRVDIVLPPVQTPVAPSASTDFGIAGLRVEFVSKATGESAAGLRVVFTKTGNGPLTVASDGNGTITYNLGGANPRVVDLRTVTRNTPVVQDLIDIRWTFNGVADSGAGGGQLVPARAVGANPLRLSAVGDTLSTALDVGIFGSGSGLTSLIFSESIDPQPSPIELLGGNSDPGRPDVSEVTDGGLGQYINDTFGINGADMTDGITEILYNFQGIYATVGSQSFINRIQEPHKARVREALDAWSSAIGIQFRETVDQGITFALGSPGVLPAGPGVLQLPTFNAAVRIDPTFNDSLLVFDNTVAFETAYGENFFRRTMGGIGLMIGLEQAPGLPPQTIMAAAPVFLEPTIPTGAPGVGIDFTGGLEPVFPGNYDILHGQHLYRPDSNDVDLYRFEVNLGDEDQIGTLTAETFAERLPDSSLLDTSITLFQEVHARAESDLGAGSATTIRFTSLANGRLGNNTRIDFIRSDRSGADNAVRIMRPTDSAGNPIDNAILVDVPRRSTSIPTVTIGQIVNAINNDPFAISILRASIVRGQASTDISAANVNLLPVVLRGGGIERLARNDDYFSEDSRLIANLGAGVYYIGVAASGNETYDPTTPNSGFGGLTQGRYDLHLKFEPQVDETDVLRDLDSDRADVPGTPLDGDADGVPGGAHNFWFQTRSLNRQINFTSDGQSVSNRQKVTITSGTGITRTYEFVRPGQSPAVGNVAVVYNDGSTGVPTPTGSLARELRNAINSRSGETGVSATVTGTVLELTGERKTVVSNDFRAGTVVGRNIFVDKTASPLADGSLSRPFNNIANPSVANAFGVALPGDIVRIVGNGGDDRNLATEADNFSYQIGVSATGGVTLEDGRHMEVPRGVTTMIDAGAILKFRTSRVGVGSSTLLEDRSGGALQVLGTPRLVQLSPQGEPITTTLIADQDQSSPGYSDGSVILTSIKDRGAATSAAGNSTAPAPGDWGGLVFRRDLDRSEGRVDLEDEGIFLQSVNHAQIRYGGGSNVLIDSVQQLVNPIQIFELRPSVTFNEISFSADAALSASPDSFEETSFQAPRFQQGGGFTADYSRIGPEIHDNRLIDNSINGMFVRVTTTPGQAPKALTTSGRFDDSDVVHYFSENIVIQGTPGGSIQDEVRPDLIATSLVALAGGGLAAGTYDYRMTYVDADGFESLASAPSPSVTVAANSSVQLLNLSRVPDAGDYISRRLYRLDPTSGQYRLIVTLDSTDADYLDNGSSSAGILDDTRVGIRARLDASLVVDPGMVLKFRGTRFELQPGTQLLAEGTSAQPIIFTSYADDRFGSGGTFDTNNDRQSSSGSLVPSPGDWSGIYAGPNSTVSFDHSTVAYGGGISLLEGGQGRGFAALELQQADGRVTNSRFEFNANAQAGSGPVGRFGRLSVTEATIFVRGSQPTIVGNVFASNDGTIIDIDSDSMGANRKLDLGRQTGTIDRFAELDDNYGPLIRLNRYADIDPAAAGTQFTGLEIRGGILAGPSVWDDTDIVHLLFNSITVGNIHSEGGLRLISRSDESLVVKSTGPGSPYDDRFGTGLIASGTLGNAADRIGGYLHIVGTPGFPVVLTSFQDDSVGAGLTPQGTAFTDSNGDGVASRAFPNDWRGILLEQNSNDRNVDYVLEQTITNEVAPGLNGTVTNAQVLGALARDTLSGNDQFRLGFEVEGLLSEDADVDTYSFTAEAGTQIWVDVDHTSLTLDTVVEILDANGNVLARSDNSFDEVTGAPPLTLSSTLVTGSLQSGPLTADDFGAGGLYKDYGSTNVRDAGMRLFLPGNPGTRSVYFFRVRSASINPDDATGGITNGGYRFQLRLREEQEFPGNVIRYTDIRYANHGIHARGQGDSSPFLGDAQEDEGIPADGRPAPDNSQIVYDPLFPNRRAQYIGNLLQSKDKVFSVGGALSSANDVDFYQIDVLSGTGFLHTPTIFDIDYADGFSRPNTSLVVFYDRDGEDGALPPELVLIATDSNVLDDLAKPVSSSNIDLLTRGSITTGDPLIGPVALSEGTYFVGVIADGAIPVALGSINARREPIESILRIFEDRVDSIGGSTALPPREAEFVDPLNLNAGWSVTTNRATDLGHGVLDTFNRSRSNFSTVSIQDEPFGSNDTFATADDLDANQPVWSIAPDGNIGNRLGNTSQLIPHTTVRGSLSNESVDIYKFVVNVDNSFVSLDIDGGFDPALTPANSNFFDATNVRTQLFLLNDRFELLDSNDDELFFVGAAGSVLDLQPPEPIPGALPLSADPYLDGFFDAGTYYVAVAREGVTYDESTDSFNAIGFEPFGGTYQLHVSVQNHAGGFGDANNASYFFDRSEPIGVLESNAFDLTGYSAKDLPRFYFNYFYNSGGTADTVVVEAKSASSPNFVRLSDAALIPATLQTANQWRQGVASLAQFAGQQDVVIRFTYNVNGTSPLAEGLYLDDFIVGFAERGEMVTGSGFDSQRIVGGTTVPGQYQLEIRPATEHARAVQTGPNSSRLILTDTFDTNDRQASETATIVAPHINQIADGNTFTLSDGIRRMRFEFDFSVTPSVTAGNIRVPVSAGFTQAQVADAIRTAINTPAVQASLRLQASDASGNRNGGTGSPVVGLSGLLIGDFLTLDSPADLPPAGDPLPGGAFKLPVVYSRGVGDVNVERAQTQLILDSNKISDSYAIGIWSRYGERTQDPADNIIFDNNQIYVTSEADNRDDPEYPFADPSNYFFFLQESRRVMHATPRLGPSAPGAVRNLPTLNNSVVGGITPGVVLVNNTIDQAGYAGIKIDGQTRPFVIDSPFRDFYVGDDSPDGAENFLLSNYIPDGLTMAIHAAGERVVFEFEDISGGATNRDDISGGSGATGGDGWQDGHIPIFYRQSSDDYTITSYAGGNVTRGASSTRAEVMWSIYQAILGSPLVTNGLVELVEPSIGPSRWYADFDPFLTVGGRTEMPAVYLEGASGISFSGRFMKGNFIVPFDEYFESDPDRNVQAAVHEPPQQFARVVNNTIYGRDGLASLYREPGTNEPNDLPSVAVDTRQGSDLGPIYQTFASLGDGVGGLADVDFYEVELGVGDRLTADVDTLPNGPNTYLRVFNSSGIEVSANDFALAPAHLNGILIDPNDPGTPLPDPDDANAIPSTVDPFVDFTATKAGTYYVAVSSAGNDSYDPLTLSGRKLGTGGSGPYGLSINVFAPRSFAFNFNRGTKTTNFGELIGTTITVTHVADVAEGRNTTTYEFVEFAPDPADPNGRPLLPDGSTADYAIGLINPSNSRISDILRTISATLSDPDFDPETDTESINARALGGELGDGPGIITFSWLNLDLQGFGHDVTHPSDPSIPSAVRSTSESFIFALGAANITISDEALAAGFHYGPYVGSNAQGGIPEAGLVTTNGTSATVMNNIFANLDQSIVQDHLDFVIWDTDRGGPHPKPSLVIVSGNLSQDDTNKSIPQDNFNVNLTPDHGLFKNADGNNLLPGASSYAIDSAINSVIDRNELRDLRNSLGLPNSNLLAPDRDINGVLRADNPNVAPPGGIGGFVFKDRGSNELADFVGPVAIANKPLDNDSLGLDSDATNGFIRLTAGSLDEFRIQLRDTGDASDPFAGLGIDDSTVIVPVIPGLRPSGANVTLFEDEKLLTEGVDYSFSYDETQNVITLTPLAGTWQSQRAYRIELNNRSRTVLTAPSANQVADGDQLRITDDSGGTIVFEFESGYSLLLPEPITLVVPQVGTNSGGLRDGDLFVIDDGINDPVTFEFNLPGDAKLPKSASTEVVLPSRSTPTSPAELQAFLEEIAENMATAIRSEIADGNLDVDVKRDGTKVVLGADAGATANTTLSALDQLPRSLALRVPASGAGPGGIVDGDRFLISNGGPAITLEFDLNGNLSNANHIRIPIVAGASAANVANSIVTTLSNLGLGFTPTINEDGRTIYLNLPRNGSASVPSGQLAVVGLSRSFTDGDTIVITGTDGQPVTFEIDSAGDGTEDQNVSIVVARADAADEIAAKVADEIRAQVIPGLNPSDLIVVPGGLVSIGGQSELQVETTGDSMQVVGSPSVATSSTITIQGPQILTFSQLGGGVIVDGSVLVLVDDQDNDVLFEFNRVGSPQTVPGAVNVPYRDADTNAILAASLTAAVNGAATGIVAQNIGNGQVSFGQIDSDRISILGYTDPDDSAATYPGVLANLRQGLVNDGEVLTIRQGEIEVHFEFESTDNGGGVAAGNIAVVFQPGSETDDVANSLAAAINNNKNGLVISASVVDGVVNLADQPGTVIDASLAPTLKIGGVPGGAIPILILPGFGPTEVKQALINAINSVNRPGQPPVTSLSAEDRGGATLFVSGGNLFDGAVTSYALPAIADVAGNPLEANRDDLTTQFTILMPNVGLDYGDAPDPVLTVSGRYPTRIANNGPRHVVDPSLSLGTAVDPDLDGLPSVGAGGDDNNLQISEQGELFAITVVGGNATIEVQSINAVPRDGDTITIDTGLTLATLEFDTDGLFDEDNYAIRPALPITPASIATAIVAAINESPLRVGGASAQGPRVTVIGDDEDGVVFTSQSNPLGVLNKSIAMPIDVTVTGAGIVEAWIDFNADGDFDDSGEQIIPMNLTGAMAGAHADLCPANLTGEVSNIFSSTEATTRTFCIVVPPSTPTPVQPLTTYARFRVSREGGLSPTGLALSGEVEDYKLTLLPGTPPIVSPAQAERSFRVNEEQTLRVLDKNGALTPADSADDGLLVGIVDEQGDAIEVFADDVGDRVLRTPSGTVAGNLNLLKDGTFTFIPVDNFNGTVEFQVRVTDVKPLNPGTALASPTPINVTITVDPVNDRPFATASQMPITRQIVEDAVQTFTAAELIGDMYAAGPANESNQPLIFQSAGSNLGPFITSLGGTLSIAGDGLSIVYTPPADYNGATPDSFTYVVADVPGNGQTPLAATQVGTVTITFLAENDPPRTTADSYTVQEGTVLSIAINGAPPADIGILDNDTAGPPDELAPPQNQTIRLVAGQFPKLTDKNGTVALSGDGMRLIYTPAPFFSGVDRFEYTVQDLVGGVADKTATEEVFINVGNVNNSPQFVGVQGNSGVTTIVRDESKVVADTVIYELNTWFNDPDGDALTFTVTSSNNAVAAATLQGNKLTLRYPAYGFGTATLTVTATDGVTAPTTQQIGVTVNNTPDAPQVIGTLNPQSVDEDGIVSANLATVFSDPDRTPLTYSVARIGTLINPTATQIANHPLIRSITFANGQMVIQLQPNKFGTADIEIAASDGVSQPVSDSFTLTVNPVQDAPIALPDGYNVPIGSALQVLNSANGLLRNDSDADGNPITVDVGSATTPTRGTLALNANGTFVYTNTSGTPGDTDSFRYHVIDSTGRISQTVTVTLTLNNSQYQNPLSDLSSDVNADGAVTAIDALRIINFLGRRGATEIPVSAIGAPPPDFYDVNGDGKVSALDALNVVNRLRDINNRGASEQLADDAPVANVATVARRWADTPRSVATVARRWADTPRSGERSYVEGTPRSGERNYVELGQLSAAAAAAVTSGFAAASSAGLPIRNVEQVIETQQLSPTDQILTAGLEIRSAATHAAGEFAFAAENASGSTAAETDAALASIFDDLTGSPFQQLD